MPELERWEQKAIGRINRFENYTGELLTNRVYEGARAGINYTVQGIMGADAGAGAGFERSRDLCAAKADKSGIRRTDRNHKEKRSVNARVRHCLRKAAVL